MYTQIHRQQLSLEKRGENENSDPSNLSMFLLFAKVVHYTQVCNLLNINNLCVYA